MLLKIHSRPQILIKSSKKEVDNGMVSGQKALVKVILILKRYLVVLKYL